ncbi:septum formation initiator family protein [Romboutsia weinsteinii]|uniref:Septum formation initiator family protein n=1 Tax=Romboutsia weinsteinii TaxID=2020949 RepID=A0A371J1J6_9FIRM|nr:septum formation initiator family protein [Romboutsia weinsteinii]RDY26640.1 septum formation initiator family protein [Romboutsia weinsteinii]
MNLMKKFSGQAVVISMFLMFLILSMASGFIFQYVKLREYKNEISSINNQIKKTEEEIKLLKNTDGNKDLEKIARERLNMVKPNEIVYIDMGKEGN